MSVSAARTVLASAGSRAGRRGNEKRRDIADTRRRDWERARRLRSKDLVSANKTRKGGATQLLRARMWWWWGSEEPAVDIVDRQLANLASGAEVLAAAGQGIAKERVAKGEVMIPLAPIRTKKTERDAHSSASDLVSEASGNDVEEVAEVANVLAELTVGEGERRRETYYRRRAVWWADDAGGRWVREMG
ncbi:hypothetical protein R3P38DRAFT_2756483 [Favolaschia claudopus]|uniref:Uncharacterized protein n=1 Tax=Favolaschia claudopus TaxID=2862362 RepID=A0AAW0EHD5_9AGAR